MDLSNNATSNFLSSLDPWKSSGHDDFLPWALKEYSIILSLSVMKILNSSCVENKLTPIWKQANVIPVAIVTPVQDMNQLTPQSNPL